MEARKSLAIAIAVSGISGLAAKAEPVNWAGPYFGVSAGGGVGDQSQHGGVLLLPSSGPGTTTITTYTSTYIPDGNYGISGALLGGGVGYNWQQERLVVGVEADGSWSSISGSGTCGFPWALPHACGGGIGALGTLRGRIGWDFGWSLGAFGSVLPFVTGGLAVGEVHAWDSLLSTSGSTTLPGWTLGGGLEAMIAPHWSVKVEYLHVNLGNYGIFTAATFPEHVSTHAEVFRIGVNYHFDLAPPPQLVVKAKY